MRTNIARRAEGSEWENESHERPRFPAKRASDSDDQAATGLFEDAVIAMKLAGREIKEISFALGLSDSHLSDMRRGARAVTIVRLVKMAMLCKTAAFVFASFFARLAGCKLVREQKVNKHQLRNQLLLGVELNPAVRDLLLVRAAKELDIDPKEAAEILDAPSEEMSIEELRARGMR